MESWAFSILAETTGISSHGGGAGRCGFRLSAAAAVRAADLGCTRQADRSGTRSPSDGGTSLRGQKMMGFMMNAVIEHYIFAVFYWSDD